jgi:hypothetical protein
LSYDLTLSNDKVIRFTYTPNTSSNPALSHNIEKLYDAKGQLYVENIYNGDDRVTSQKYGSGFVQYEYTRLVAPTNPNVTINTPFIQTKVTNRAGVVTRYTYNNRLATLERKIYDQIGN